MNFSVRSPVLKNGCPKRGQSPFPYIFAPLLPTLNAAHVKSAGNHSAGPVRTRRSSLHDSLTNDDML